MYKCLSELKTAFLPLVKTHGSSYQLIKRTSFIYFFILDISKTFRLALNVITDLKFDLNNCAIIIESFLQGRPLTRWLQKAQGEQINT